MANRVTYYANSASRTTTTTTDYSVTKVVLSFSPSANKTYAILWSAILDGNNVSHLCKVRLINSTSSVVFSEQIMNPRSTTVATSNISAGGIALYTAPASPVSQTIQIQVAASNSALTVGIQEAKVFIIQLVDGMDIWGSSVAEQTTTGDYTSKLVLSWTPPSAGDYFSIVSGELFAGQAQIKARTNVDIDVFVNDNLNVDYYEPTDPAWAMYVGGYRHIGITAATAVALQWGSVNAVAAPIRNAYGVAFRTSEFGSKFWESDRTSHSSTTATYTDAAYLSGTPAAVRYLTLAFGMTDVEVDNAYGTATATRIAVDGVGQGSVFSQQRGWPLSYRNWIDFAVRTEAAVSTAWSTQYARTAGAQAARTDEHVLGVFQIDDATAPAVELSYVGIGTRSAGDHDDILGPSLPSGIAAGDLLIAFGYLRNAGTLSISAGWTDYYTIDVSTPSAFYLKVWYRFATGSDSAPTITPSAGSTAPQSLTQSFVIAYRGVDTTTPFGTPGADSFNTIAATVGPIAAPASAPTYGAAIVLGVRNATVWTSVPTLSGDGLTWVEDFDNYTNTVAGLGISLVMNHAIWSGASPTITSKTYSPVGGASAAGMGKMFILNAASTEPPPLERSTQLSVDAVAAVTVSASVSADCVIAASTGIFLGTLATADDVTDMVPPLPVGVVDGDILIAYGYLRGAGTLSISSGWTQHFVADLVPEIYLQTWYTVYDGSQVAPTITTTGGSVSPQTLSMSFIIAARGYNQANPFGSDGADSVNVTQPTVGPIAVPPSLPSAGAVLVSGWRNATPWTSVPTLTGDGLTWVELFDNYIYSLAGRSINGVINYATWSGGAPTLTTKTFSPVGGAAAPAYGKMCVLNANLAVTKSLVVDASVAVAVATTTTVFADAAVVLGARALSVSADVNVTLAGTGTVGASADAAVRVSRTATVLADVSVGSLTRSVTLSADASVINTATRNITLSADASVAIGKRTISEIIFCDTVVIPAPLQEGVLSAIGELSAERTDTAWLVLLTLNHPDLAAPIRVTSDGVSTVSGGNVFSPFPFEVVLPDDVEGRPPQAQLSIDNTTQEVIAALRGLTSPPKLTVQIVRSVNTDVIEYQWIGLEWSNSSYDKSVITGTLTFQDITREEFPYETYDGRFQGLFSS